MPLDPPLRLLFPAPPDGSAPPQPPSDLGERRRLADSTMLLASTGPQDGVTVVQHTVDVPDGQISVRVTAPAAAPAPGPAVFFIHGGGWFQGNLDTGEIESGPLASTVPCVVVSVEYRLAPEHPFPVPLEDCVAAYRWMLDRVDELDIDPERIAIAGCSAGANLAVALCLTARDRGLPMPCFQLLDAPCLDLTLSSPSMREQGTGWGLTYDAVDTYAGYYVGTDVLRSHPRVSPLLEPDLTGLPPAMVVVAELDPVRDDGERYLARLHEAGVVGVGLRVLSHFHGGWIIPVTATFGVVGDLRAGALRRAFAGTFGR